MNYDEFAFFNQQLASMLREGIPLEGALKQLCVDLKNEPLRREIQQLESDLASGVPLKDALTHRQLPSLYRRMVEIGARSNDLPGVLTLLADHYQHTGALWNRLKGLMVYPLIVIFVSLAITLALSFILSRFMAGVSDQLMPMPFAMLVAMWVPPLMMATVGAAGLIVITNPTLRSRMRWRIPAFREASLAQLASALALMLKNGVPLPEALALAEMVESNSPAGRALGHWRQLVENGEGKPSQWPRKLGPFPPLFLWLVQKGGEDVGAGFQKAAQLYQTRAAHRIELALYGALPVSVLLLGQMILWQMMPIIRSFTSMMNMLGS